MPARPAPRPKRESEVFARTHYNDDAEPGHSAKRPRFDPRNPSLLAGDAPEEDLVLEADEIGKATGVKRNAVNIDGYDSDSDPDVAKWQKDTEGEVADDMFAEDDGAESEEDRRKDKKEVRFMDAGDIVGQVMSSSSGGHVKAGFASTGTGKQAQRDPESDSESSEDGDDETRAAIPSNMDEELGAGSKKKHAPRLEAFNLRNENEEGRFDENGNYVRKAADPNETYDSWLDGLSKKEIKKAKEAHDKREEERRQKDLEKDAILTSDVLSRLIKLLQPDETPLEALQRLGKKASKPKQTWKQRQRDKRSDDAMAVDEPSGDTEAEKKRQETMEAVTEAATLLMDRGHQDIYQLDRDDIMTHYKRETGERWVNPEAGKASNGSADKTWYFRWADARDGVDQHGPYDKPTMQAWTEAGYFGEGVEFKVNDDGDWTSVASFE